MNNLLPNQLIKIQPIAPINSRMHFESLIAFKMSMFAKNSHCITHQRLIVTLAVWAGTQSCGEQAKPIGIGCALFLLRCSKSN